MRCWAKPKAAALPESGTGTIISASTSFSFASSFPKFFRCSYAVFSSKILSGRAKYIYSKTQGLTFLGGKGLTLFNSLFSIKTISPFSTSLINFAPIISRAQVSDAKT